MLRDQTAIVDTWEIDQFIAYIRMGRASLEPITEIDEIKALSGSSAAEEREHAGAVVDGAVTTNVESGNTTISADIDTLGIRVTVRLSDDKETGRDVDAWDYHRRLPWLHRAIRITLLPSIRRRVRRGRGAVKNATEALTEASSAVEKTDFRATLCRGLMSVRDDTTPLLDRIIQCLPWGAASVVADRACLQVGTSTVVLSAGAFVFLGLIVARAGVTALCGQELRGQA